MNKHAPITAEFFVIEGRAIAQAMKLMMAIVERRSTYSVLSCALLRCDGSTLTIRATDLDIEATTALDLIDGGTAGKPWQMVVTARVLAAIAKVAGVAGMKVERIERDGEDTARITIGDDVTYELRGLLSPDTFATLPGERGAVLETFTNGQLAELLGKVSWCVSTEETRYYLNGVSWQASARGRRMAATDGHRLAVCRYAANENVDTNVGRIIPSKSVRIIMAHTAGKDVTVHQVQGREVIELVLGRTTIRTKLIEGTFPDIDRVIPKPESSVYAFTAPCDRLLAALDQVVALRDQNSVAIHFHRHERGDLALKLKSANIGDAVARTGVAWPDRIDTKGAKPISIPAHEWGFNARYIADVLAHCQGDVTIHQIDASAPFRIADADETMTRVLMPMRV